MEKYITDERTGLKYELVGDYYLLAGDDDPAPNPLGIWGRRRERFLRQYQPALYMELLLDGTLEEHLQTVDHNAESRFQQLMEQLPQTQDIPEQLKVTNPLAWAGTMTNLQSAAREIVEAELIYA